MGRYSTTRILKNDKGNRYYSTTRYPEIPRSNSDIYVVTTIGDRFDILANQYYGNPSLWWVIASANPEYVSSLYPPPGIQLRIPANIADIIQNV